MDYETTRLIELCKRYEQLYIYGAGRNANILYSFLEKQKIIVKGFVVSDIQDNPKTLFDLSVVSVEEFRPQIQSLILVSIVKESKAFKEVFDCLVKNRIHNAYFISCKLIQEATKEPLPFHITDIFQDEIYHLGEGIPVEKYHSILLMKGVNGEEYHWRFRNDMIYEQDIRNISNVLNSKSALEEFEELYGKYFPLQSLKQILGEKRKNCIIYMAQSHVDKEKGSKELLPKWIMPIQVGAALTDKRTCVLMDNMGDNISERNGIYSECSGLYWMWKNAPRTDYIGLCHYRRHFHMSKEELVNLMGSNADVLVTSPTFVNETVGVFLATLTPHSDFKVMLDAIEQVYPKYYQTAQKFLRARFYPPCNMFIMKWELFQEYAAFVFSIAFEIERFYDELGFMRKDRYMGYLIECLLGIFLMQHKERLKIAYTDMEFYE